ncbi:Tetratricopeptide repeat-containing protein [Verrucomicrobium sp. GAS474]|uniref:tetratricopeptide repeat protein n=1 Tax=Verrucomicrobium sp. GAS474 TaxID=1882831 RepID=UPI0008795078|nr:tetratricopeptide repeat protein [Verrucomicrobium sp. GAS474]SDT96969.1 Tetratricopeptide repeat-containing protein [Verrucomicrobium sp. GAS474]
MTPPDSGLPVGSDRPSPPLWAFVLGLAALTFVAYLRALGCGFTNFDDDLYVTANPRVLAGLSLDGIGWAFGGWYGGFWQPLVWISYMLNVARDAAGHLDPFPFHLTNVLLHVGNTVLLFLLLRSLTKGKALWRSALVAALFALHPLHVESVAWIAERKDVLSTFFWFAAMWAYTAYARAGRRRWHWYGLTALLFALGLMAKPMLVTFPFVLLLLDFWPLNRLPLDLRVLGRRIAEKLPFLLLSIAAAALAFQAVAAYGEVRADVPFGDRLANALLSYAGYLRKALWPDDLIAFYLLPSTFPVWGVLGSFFLLAAITGLVLSPPLLRGRPWLAVGWLWFLGTLVPVIGIVKSGYYAMADRYTYVPLVGLFVIAAWELAAFARLSSRSRWQHLVAVVAASLLLPLLLALSVIQIGQWQSSVTLFTRMLEVGPDHSLAHFNLATGLLEQGDLAGAEYHFRRCLALRPDYADARNLLAQTLLRLGRPEPALREAQIASRLAPRNFDTHHTVAVALNALGRRDEAIVEFRNATLLAPGYPAPHRNLALLLRQAGRTAEARAEFEAALRIDPRDEGSRRALQEMALPLPPSSPKPDSKPPTVHR